MKRPLVILGTGGNCLDIHDAVLGGAEHEVVGYLDDAAARHGTTVRSVPVLGPLSRAAELDGCLFVNGIGSPTSFRSKAEIVARTRVPDERFATVVHPAATVSPSASIAAGSVVLAGVVLCAGVTLGRHVMMLPNCVVGHDSSIGDHATLAAGVIVSGHVMIGAASYLGAAASIRHGIRIGERALVGMGSVVVRDVPAGAVVAGNPARPFDGRPGTP